MEALLLSAPEVSNDFPQKDFTATPLLMVQIKASAKRSNFHAWDK
jgi:hypothetical protein